MRTAPPTRARLRPRRLVTVAGLTVAALAISVSSAVAGPVDVSVGDGFACTMTQSPTTLSTAPLCWGSNGNGQFSGADRGWTILRPSPLHDIRALSSPSQISVGMEHWCAVALGGTGNGYGCMGASSFGQTGRSFPDYNVPFAGFRTVSAGGYHTCAVTLEGAPWCWGRNESGQLGTGGTATSSDAPTKLDGLTSVRQISAGGFHTCAIARGGVWCWGANNLLQSVPRASRDASASAERAVTTPTRVTDGDGAVEVAAGDNHTCARWAAGTVRCWGYNDRGQLGSGGLGGNIIRGRDITPVALPAPATAITAGDKHTCAIVATTEVYCWGFNSRGQLGNGRGGGTDYDGVPQRVGNLRFITRIDAGWGAVCALSKFGGLWCWGRGEVGQLGNGASGSGKWTSTPQAVTGFPDSDPAMLTVQIERPDLGRVVTDPSFIDCASTECSAEFAKGKSVRLTARAIPGAELVGWDGACTGNDDDCVVSMDQAQTVRAIFQFPRTHTLSVEFAGDIERIGSPVVWVETDSGLRTVCTGLTPCQVAVPNGASAVLRADPGRENVFSNWLDGCTGTDDSCVIAMDRDRRVIANIPLRATIRVTASLAGEAPGSVEDAASGLWCRSPEDPARPNRCSVDVPRGTTLSVVTTPLIAGDTAVTGACSPVSSPCLLTPRRSLGFTTYFRSATRHTVAVSIRGTGKGQVVGPGINCGRDCTSDEPIASPYSASYIATPATGSVFVRWEGPICKGDNATCVASMPGAIVAIFAAGTPPPTATLNVAARGTGRGRVISAPNGVDCGDACSTTFRTFDAVTLTAVAAPESHFDHWSGACVDTSPTCRVDMSASRRAIAVFAKNQVDPEPTPGPAPSPGPAPQVLPQPGPNPASPDSIAPPPTRLTLTGISLQRSTLRSGGTTRLSYSLSRNADVVMTFRRPRAKAPTYRYVVRAGANGADAGRNSVLIRARVKGRNVRPGRWEMTITARTGQLTTRPVKRRLNVRAR